MVKPHFKLVILGQIQKRFVAVSRLPGIPPLSTLQLMFPDQTDDELRALTQQILLDRFNVIGSVIAPWHGLSVRRRCVGRFITIFLNGVKLHSYAPFGTLALISLIYLCILLQNILCFPIDYSILPSLGLCTREADVFIQYPYELLSNWSFLQTLCT